MNAEIFSQWLLSNGYSVHKTKSSYWYNAGFRVYQAFPYHWEIVPEEKEIAEFILKHRVLALRYSTIADSKKGCLSYHAVCSDLNLSLDSLSAKSRRNVRYGLRNCEITPITLQRMAEEGYDLAMETAIRQKRRTNITKKKWIKQYLSAADLPGFEAWGALCDNKLVASALVFLCDDCYSVISSQSCSAYLKFQVNNALYFCFTKELIKRLGVRSIFGGLQSLDAPSSVDTFKFRLGYVAKAVRQRVVFNQLLKPLTNKITYKILGKLRKLDRKNIHFAKAEGIMRLRIEETQYG